MKLIVDSKMKKACITAYDAYKKFLREKKEVKEKKKQQKIDASVILLKQKKAKWLAKLIKLKNKRIDNLKRNSESAGGSSASRWKRIKLASKL